MFDYSCSFCGQTAKSIRDYFFHVKLHRNEYRFHIKCPYKNCFRQFTSLTAMQSHITRKHSGMNRQHSSPKPAIFENTIQLRCIDTFCCQKVVGIKKLISHVGGHARCGSKITCPFENCDSIYSRYRSFQSHIRRKHDKSLKLKTAYYVDFHDANIENNTSLNESQEILVDDGASPISTVTGVDSKHQHIETTDGFKDLMLRNMALFYLRLQAKYLVPSSTIQCIHEGITEMHDLSQQVLKQSISTLISQTTFSEESAEKIDLNHLLTSSDLFSKHCAGELRSEYLRVETFKNLFHFVNPLRMRFGCDEFGNEKFFFYVPILNTLSHLLSHSSILQEFLSNAENAPSNNDTQWFKNIHDGKAFKSNLFLKDGKKIRIILYQDALELCNPLGSSKGIHKILAVYFTLENFSAHHRSSIDQMQLALLCHENDAKHFGIDHLFTPLVKDLKTLESVGITLRCGTVVKGSLLFIIGDNLGSHAVGGYSESFSKNMYWCRYCTIKSTEFHANPLVFGKNRTRLEYNSALKKLYLKKNACRVTGRITMKSNSVEGIKKTQFLTVLNIFMSPVMVYLHALAMTLLKVW
jgi:hypothetical protein